MSDNKITLDFETLESIVQECLIQYYDTVLEEFHTKGAETEVSSEEFFLFNPEETKLDRENIRKYIQKMEGGEILPIIELCVLKPQN